MTFYFPKFSFPNTFWVKFCTEISKYYVLNEAQFVVVLFKIKSSEYLLGENFVLKLQRAYF